MEKRRQFLKTTVGFLTGMGLVFSPFFKLVQMVYGKAQKIILPKGTNRKSLINKDPSILDSRNLETTPLKAFETMGLTDHEVNPDAWHLEVTGRVENSFTLSYEEILTLPPIERRVLLICPGFFANHGKWKGISAGKLLEKAKIKKGVTYVTFSGPKGIRKKVEKFPIEDILSDKVFLAYNVNGETLPKKHGFPLRVVAEGYYGSDWVKYVNKIKVGKA